jgi:hypothetical protein
MMVVVTAVVGVEILFISLLIISILGEIVASDALGNSLAQTICS